ncbi:hypothetical protein FOLKNPGA_00472 [Legionella sp. PC1000]|uniref:hypothetical protein n=1 Tax=Legionella sp. PC1000 TaxID=2746060 RepID=UPI0015FA3E28|nr:hypothetical protein [Legionella sp. PC1000]QLZ67699.1 hypothetical protein FOLKNPGA_00472 [Legionella sp. PC1000]
MAKKLKTIVKKGTTTTTKEQSLHSDHHPQLFGKTLIWNIDKDNANDDLEMKAFAIAQKINKGEVTSGMLQEVPHDSQEKLIANIQKYLDPKQKLSMRYNQNGTHPFGNLTFSCNPVTPTPNQALEKDVKKLQQKYEDSGASKGQVLITLVEDENGKKRLLVNVHAESPPKPGAPLRTRHPPTPRVDLNQVMKDMEQFRKNHRDIDVVVGGDMNKGRKSLPKEMPNYQSNPNFRYQHSEPNTAFKQDGAGVAVDAVFSTEQGVDLKTQKDMNFFNRDFEKAFDKSKKEKEKLAQQEKMKPVVDLQKNLKSSPAFTTATVHTGNYQQKIKQDTQQDFPVKLVFQDARQARQFTNHVALRDKKNLFQNENEIYLTQGAVAKILTLDINQPKLVFTHVHQGEKLSTQRKEELQQSCVEQIKAVTGKQISAAPTVQYENTKIRQDTRGEIDYSMKLTFANKEEARAFSDAMGYKNKTLLFQKGDTVYIAKEAEADFLKKMCKTENTASFKTHLATLKSSSPPQLSQPKESPEEIVMSAPKSAKGPL